MKTKLAVLLAFVVLFSSCAGIASNPSEPDRNFYYKNTTWGMSVEDVLKAMGTPDIRTDELEETPKEGYLSFPIDGQSPSPQDDASGEASAPAEDIEYLDFYYNDKMLFDKYVVDEKVLFDEAQKLWGVIDLVDIGELKKDLTNRDEIDLLAKESYLDMREILTAEYGPPAAEYTAYQEAGEYKTDETLDLEKKNAIICASRWDGDNYRFIYIIYFMNDLSLDVRYIPHDKEKVDAAKAQDGQQ